MKRHLYSLILIAFLITSCASVNLEAPISVYDTGVDSNAWATIPAGEFLYGQFDAPTTIGYDYEMMVTDVTVAQYVRFMDMAIMDETLKYIDGQILGFYPGDMFHGAKHEVKIPSGDYLIVPLADPASRFIFDGGVFQVKSGYENHPMTNVTWFGAWTYCGYYGWRLPTEMEWEKAARGTDGHPFPWGDAISLNNANYYASRDPFEDMASFGSRTSPVGFYNGRTYDGYATLESASPYGLYDMVGNVWQWTGDVYEGQHYRYMRGGSKDTYDMDLRVWVRNNVTPTYYGPDVGFRCLRMK